MGFVIIDTIDPGDVSSAAGDSANLTRFEAVNVEGVNLRPESVTVEHLATVRELAAADTELATVTWIDTASGTGTSTPGDADPGTDVAPGGTALELIPPNATRARLESGDVLRWHFACNVDSVNYAADAADDRYYVEVLIAGVDDNGAAVKGGGDGAAYGVVWGYSMNTAAIDAASDGAGTIRSIADQRIHVSGLYLHEGEFSAAGGNVRITRISVRIYVQDAANSVTVSHATLTAMICKG